MEAEMEGAALFLVDILRTFRKHKALADAAIAQVSADDLLRSIDAEANSIAVLMRHVSGNLRSRFTDFLTTNGEKPDRDRDAEFATEGWFPEAVRDDWNDGWAVTLSAIAALQPRDLVKTVHIGGEAFAVVEALDRAANHTSYHVGQIVLLAKHWVGAEWRTLSIPKGQSAAYANRRYKQEPPSA